MGEEVGTGAAAWDSVRCCRARRRFLRTRHNDTCALINSSIGGHRLGMAPEYRTHPGRLDYQKCPVLTDRQAHWPSMSAAIGQE